MLTFAERGKRVTSSYSVEAGLVCRHSDTSRGNEPLPAGWSWPRDRITTKTLLLSDCLSVASAHCALGVGRLEWIGAESCFSTRRVSEPTVSIIAKQSLGLASSTLLTC